MGRPRRGIGLSADVRLENAFLEQLQVTPFQRITVSGIAKAAGLNRNSFYYHYADLEDLAQSAVSSLLVTDIPRLLAEGLGIRTAQVDHALFEAVQDARLPKLLAVCGPNSTEQLRDMFKTTVIDVWLEAFHLSRENLDADANATLHFILGGMLELFSQVDEQDPSQAFMMMKDLPIRHASAQILMDTLRALAVASREPSAPASANGQ